MLLKEIRIYLRPDDYDRELKSLFLFSSCYVSNYMTRRVRELKWKTENLQAILFQGCESAHSHPESLFEKNLIVPVPFDKSRYESLDKRELHEFFVAMFSSGLNAMTNNCHVPVSQLREFINDFRVGGYRNEWIYKKKMLRAVGLQAFLHCRLDIEKFILTLRLEREDTIIFDEPILRTRPSETFFVHEFKDIVLEGRTIVVTNKLDEPTFTLDLGTLDCSI